MAYKLTREALIALDEIAHYIALDNETAAEKVTSKVLETCSMLAEMPNIGRHPSFSGDPELLYHPVNKYQHYLIFYRESSGGITIVDVVHGMRDLPNLFGNN